MILLDFYANWCIPCKLINPIVEDAARELNYTLQKVNVEEDIELANKYNVLNLPTVILVDELGVEIKRVVGLKKNLAELLIMEEY